MIVEINYFYLAILLVVATFVDVILTYFTARKMRKRNPRMDYSRFELNEIVRWLWRKFGLEIGTLIGGILTIIISVLLIVYIFSVQQEFLLFFAGIDTVVIFIHFRNWTG